MIVNNLYKEEELVSLITQKDKQAFSYLYDKYAPPLYTVVLQIVREEELANEVLQKVFADIMNDIEVYDAAKESFFTWQFKIARNLAIDLVKSRNNSQIKTPDAIIPNMLHKVNNLELHNYGLKKIIMKLKDENKILIDLCYYRGFTHDEIAKALDIPNDTVGLKLRMAFLELKTFLL